MVRWNTCKFSCDPLRIRHKLPTPPVAHRESQREDSAYRPPALLEDYFRGGQRYDTRKNRDPRDVQFATTVTVEIRLLVMWAQVKLTHNLYLGVASGNNRIFIARTRNGPNGLNIPINLVDYDVVATGNRREAARLAVEFHGTKRWRIRYSKGSSICDRHI